MLTWECSGIDKVLIFVDLCLFASVFSGESSKELAWAQRNRKRLQQVKMNNKNFNNIICNRASYTTNNTF